MENLLVNVDGIPQDINFELQEDGWYYNQTYSLLIDPDTTYCITDQNTEYTCLPTIAFRFLDHV